MNQPYVGQIIAAGFSLVPEGWVSCNGAQLSIGQYPALFSVIGTIYGGDGKSTFAVPNLNGRMLCGGGHGTDLTPVNVGTPYGGLSTTLTLANVPDHTHAATLGVGMRASSLKGNTDTPVGNYLAATPTETYASSDTIQMGVQTDITDLNVQPTGASNPAPFTIEQPVLVLNYFIATQGLPSKK